MKPDTWPLPERAFHIADAENWNSIRRTGLHSTLALIERDGLKPKAAQDFTSYRSRGMRLPSGVLVRDQCPMPPGALRRCLDAGLSPEAWYAMVNAKVFFWLQPERLNRHLAACGSRAQVVLAVDLRELLRRHGCRAFVTPFNVGNARRLAARRGQRSFVPLEAWLQTRWDTEAERGRPARSRSHPPAEIAIEGSVPDLMELVREARPIEPGQAYCVIP